MAADESDSDGMLDAIYGLQLPPQLVAAAPAAAATAAASDSDEDQIMGALRPPGAGLQAAEGTDDEDDIMAALRPLDPGPDVVLPALKAGCAPVDALAHVINNVLVRSVGDQVVGGEVQAGHAGLHMVADIRRQALRRGVPRSCADEDNVTQSGASTNLACKALYSRCLSDGRDDGVRKALAQTCIAFTSA